MPTASHQVLAPAHLLSLAIATALLAPAAHADFVADSKASLTTSNIYLNRDFREGTGTQQNKREEWGQGFWLDVQSGYTEGTVGFGLDALGLVGVKLDSGGGRTGTDLLPVQDDGGTPDQFGRLGLTAKIKVSNTELRYGSHVPELPVVKASDSRLLPQVFEGGLLTSSELDGLTFTGGRLDKVIDRASTNSEELILNSKNRRFAAGITADHLDLMGLDYQFAKGLTGRYYFADLDDIYRQHFFGLLASQPLGSGTLSADVRLMLSKDSGASNAGKIDNRAFNAMLTYAINGHKLGLGFQDMSGDTGYAYIDGSDPFLVNFVQINDFANADERSWQARYDYDFGKLGVPGLSFMTRYIKGSDAQIAGTDDTGGEWERDIEVKYVVQSGPLKDVYVRLRNASFKSDFARDADENRVIVGYTLPIW
ncbi:OprD family porin [Pseudomonas anguilliseptica]|uniref:OprD family porin n=1 Tax=Pseudomonas anguilliseptica TaxID=53406 RepID=UPI001F3D56A9|nr:OprD family porin [Pseudomonas anguilliseptica]MCE5364918.1 OprD family porin [Pseudomonas anguilliseptica]